MASINGPLVLRPTGVLSYEDNPYAYYLQYVLQIRSEGVSHALAFGTAGHKAVLAYVAAHARGEEIDVAPIFEFAWDEQLATKVMTFSSKDAATLREIGVRLARQFPAAWKATGMTAVVVGDSALVENRLRVHLADDLVLSAEPDIVARDATGALVVPDIKFPGSASFEGFAKVSDQLTAYQLCVNVHSRALGLGDEAIGAVGFVEGLKKKGAEWKTQMAPAHTRQQLGAYVAKVKYIAAQIRQGYFPLRSGAAWNSPLSFSDYSKLIMEGDATGLSSPFGDVLELVNTPVATVIQDLAKAA